MQDINKITKHVTITPTTLGDISLLNNHARFEDRREVEDISGQSLIANLYFALAHANPCLTAYTLTGKLLCVFGVIPSNLHTGIIALLGTDEIRRHKAAFLRGSVDVLHYLTSRHYQQLYNVVDARNSLHIAYLEWLGFEMGQRREAYGHAKIPVIEFGLNVFQPEQGGKEQEAVNALAHEQGV